MAWRSFTAAMTCLAMHASAWAVDVRVEVKAPNGEPIANAVVTISGPAVASSLRSDGLVMQQKDLAFSPFVLVVPRGASVSFPNFDQTRHHVYSFSPAGPFELKLYGAGETRSVRFTKTGTIAVGCNIHDQMTAFIRVTDAPWAAVTDKMGVVELRNVDAGDRLIEVWHPQQKGSPDATLTSTLAVPASGRVSKVVQLTVRNQLDFHPAY
ncbi:MAG: methylamine utilization protein [Hyphomonadaceae bacterium]|nr:methylamine utilization protein [Hyphomonadaceae bacterium]